MKQAYQLYNWQTGEIVVHLHWLTDEEAEELNRNLECDASHRRWIINWQEEQ